MPILRHNRFFCIALLMCSIIGCQKNSINYEKLSDLPPSEWNSFAKTIPIEDRLNLHIEIMSKSGPNPPHDIIESFDDDPDEVYHLLVRKVKNGEDRIYLVPIIYEIAYKKNFNFCEKYDRKILQIYLSKWTGEPLYPKELPNFYKC